MGALAVAAVLATAALWAALIDGRGPFGMPEELARDRGLGEPAPGESAFLRVPLGADALALAAATALVVRRRPVVS